MQWSPQQDHALKTVERWLKDKSAPQVFRLFGWAGTGKSTLAVHLSKHVRSVKFAAFTGKAALVMRKRGCTGAQTIHSLIYTMVSESSGGEPRFMLNTESPAADADLIVVDEVSMVDEVLGRDLLSFGTKVLVLGDPFQLPPVKGTGFFIQEPDIMLTEIHRQAADNPIIRLSMDVREGRNLERGTYGDCRVISRYDVDAGDILAADQVIVGRNNTRVSYNNRIRQHKSMPDEPAVGDKIICLKNNVRLNLLNGQMWNIESVRVQTRGALKMQISPEEGRQKIDKEVRTHVAFFQGREAELDYPTRRGFEEFTYGYAVTCHKAQGSQWDNVYLFDESFAFREHQKNWLYTALTRAAERITIVS